MLERGGKCEVVGSRRDILEIIIIVVIASLLIVVGVEQHVRPGPGEIDGMGIAIGIPC